jgi:pilus assembly protein CpaE
MRAASAPSTAAADKKSDRQGVLAVVQDQQTLDRVQGVVRELQLEDEFALDTTIDAALRRMREGAVPRVLLFDLSDSTAPIAELSAARSVGGAELKIVALGVVNDVHLFRDLIAAGASDYMVKDRLSRDALAAVLEKQSGGGSGPGAGLGQVVVFVGSRGGVGTTTAAIACAWMLAERHNQTTALVDLDLHFGTVALHHDTDPGGGLCEALEQPSRIDALFVDRATVKVSEKLRILAAEAAVAETLMIDAGAIDVLLYELRRKFQWIIIDMPRAVTPTQRVVIGAASKVVILCERSLAGLRDTIRLQTLMREQAPQTQIVLLEAGMHHERATVGKAEFEKAVGKSLDVSLSYDAKSTGAAHNQGQPLPIVAPRSPVVREIDQLIAALSGPAVGETQKRKLFGLSW